jgi:hypothetical protein
VTHRDFARRLNLEADSVAHLCPLEFKTIGKQDPGAIWLTANGAGDRLHASLQDVRNDHLSAPFSTISRDFQWGEDRFEKVRADGGKNLEVVAAVLCAVERDECRALVGGGAVVDDAQPSAVAFRNRGRLGVDAGKAHAVEPDVAEVAFLDLEGGNALASTVGRKCIELAGAGPRRSCS